MVASPIRDNIPLFQANHGGVPADFLTTGNGVGDYCYYRQPNGWITVSPIGKNSSDLHRYQDEGWTPLLREYGPFDFPREYYVNHPFEVLFLRDGAHEMPVAQIRALGYDRNPPILPRCNLALGEEHMGPTRRPIHFARCWAGAQRVEFPQLDGTAPAPVPECEFCERNDFTSMKGREQHMRVLHIEELREIAAAREMAKSVGAVMATYGGKGTPLPAKLPFICGLCDESFAKLRGAEGLETHYKLHGEDEPADATDEDA